MAVSYILLMMVSGPQNILGIDIGGSFIKSAPVDTSNGHLLAERYPIATPSESAPSVFADRLKAILARFSWQGPVGIGFPGVVRQGTVSMAAHLSQEWLGTNAVATFQRALSVPVTVLNDADAAGLAELRFGAGRTDPSISIGTTLVLTFGTGIGSALFVNGQLVPNTEFGHTFLAGGQEGEEIAAAAVRTRDNLSWEDWSSRVSRFLSELEKLVNPDRIILGGGIVENFSQFERMIKTRAPILPARLGNNAGLIGAALAATL